MNGKEGEALAHFSLPPALCKSASMVVLPGKVFCILRLRGEEQVLAEPWDIAHVAEKNGITLHGNTSFPEPLM